MAEHRFLYERRVEFHETDLAGIVHFANFFRYMEATEHAFYRHLGFSVHDFQPEEGGPKIGWPRVQASADYQLPLEFEEVVTIELLVEEVRNRSIRYLFRFWKDTPDGKKLAATGRFSVVCVTWDPEKGGMRASMIPDSVKRGIVPAPAELLETPVSPEG